MTLEAQAPARATKPVKPGFIEKTLAGITSSIETAIFSEENARRDGFLQRRDPRVKLIAFVALVTATAISRDWQVLLGLYAVVLLVAYVSAIDMDLYLKRVWLGLPVFSFIVVLPSIFFVGHEPLVSIDLGPITPTVYRDGLFAALIFVLRVGVSVSLAILLILTTKWADILKSLRVLHVPGVFILVISMTYRYVFLFLHTTNGMFLARKSRIVARTSGSEQRWWIVAAIGVLMHRSFRMSEEVYQAMVARGFTNELRSLADYRLGGVDVVTLIAACGVAGVAIYAGEVWL
jgi:cobalt/nickel transport system permease protein